MENIKTIASNFAASVSRAFHYSCEKVSQWSGHAVKVIKNTPQSMQNSPLVACGVIGTANVLFFGTIHMLIKSLDNGMQEINNDPKKTRHRIWKNTILSLITGGFVYAFNDTVLPKLTQYPISRQALAIVTASAVALRFLLSWKKNDDVEVDGAPIVNKDDKLVDPAAA